MDKGVGVGVYQTAPVFSPRSRDLKYKPRGLKEGRRRKGGSGVFVSGHGAWPVVFGFGAGFCSAPPQITFFSSGHAIEGGEARGP